MSAFATMLAIASLHAGAGNAFAQSLEFSASVPAVTSAAARQWPHPIVTFTNKVLIPVAAICNADCNVLVFRQEQEARRHRLVRVEGQGPMAIVPVEGESMVLTACVRGACMDYHVMVAHKAQVQGTSVTDADPKTERR